jgi:hypothetical protein
MACASYQSFSYPYYLTNNAMAQGRAKRIGWLLALLLACLNTRAQGRIDYADWHLEWAEEFNTPLDTTVLAERWRFFYPWGRAPGAEEQSYYTAKELQIADGVLNMTAHRQPEPWTYAGKTINYTTPMLFSRHPADSLRPAGCNADNGFSYGLFEVRVRQPRSSEMPPGFWLWGGVPDEIDIFEGNSLIVANNVHMGTSGSWRPTLQAPEDCQCFFYNADPAGNLHQHYHTYGMSWLPNEIIFYFDGLPIRRETRLVPAGCAMSVILNMTAYAWAHPLTDTLAVDYMRIYRPRKLPYVPPMLRPGSGIQPELAWLPAAVQPGRLDQGTHQTWALAPQRQDSTHLRLVLTDNYNPPCNQLLPLPVAGNWAPTWTQTAGTPELLVQVAAPDSLHWAV